MIYFSFACLALIGLLAVSAGSASAADKDHPVVVLDTSMGPITLELDRAKAPITVDNFLKHVDAKHYDGTIFHRVIPKFMIQGGGFDANAKSQRDAKESGEPIKNEAGNGLKNRRGTIAMARTGDPDSAKAQFFINLIDNDFLDRENAQDGFGYTVFGKVAKGEDVVDKIAAAPAERNSLSESCPLKAIVIKSARRQP